MIVVLGFAFIAGILSILAPCSLPVLPVVLGAAGAPGSRIAGVFIGFAMTFVIATVVVSAAFASLGISTAGLRVLAAVVLAAVGVSLAVPALGDLLGRWIRGRDQRPRPIAQEGTRGFGVGLAIGASLGLVWAPCVGPIMAAVIASAAVAGPSPTAVLIASAYVAGAIVPLATMARWGRRLMPTRQGLRRRAEVTRRAFGVAMAIAAVFVLTGLDITLASRVASVLPPGLARDLLAIEEQPAVQEGLQVLRPSPTTGTTSASLEDLGAAPELIGISDWINTPALTMAGLRGKVVLVEFWTFACSNCKAVQPYVVGWHTRYATEGLVVVAVHTPELSFERDLGNLRAAVNDAGLRYPIAVDPDYATWNAFHNHYWPALYFVDRRGHIRHVHYGEGDYDGSEAVIRKLLEESP